MSGTVSPKREAPVPVEEEPPAKRAKAKAEPAAKAKAEPAAKAHGKTRDVEGGEKTIENGAPLPSFPPHPAPH